MSANLAALANNGGPTLSHLPNTGSPAIDAGSPSTPGSGGPACPASDQRGYYRPVDGDTNSTARCDMGATEFGASAAIIYTYDPLNRLTRAQYPDGTFFTYTYDAVGNRLTQQTQSGTTSYTYDDANRLTNAGGVAYTWNANGNLINDGVLTYTYDTVNRLSNVTGAGLTASYAYNGMGDRHRQVTGGITTTYALDLNAGLVQVLADSGANTYLYGNGRIAQFAGTTASYFLADHLGSVRQLTSASGAVTLAKGYQPYGNVLNSSGSGASSYGFTGELSDNTGLVYLRARYFAPSVGRFISRDVWPGSYHRPQSLNAWQYVEANPINLTDRTGQFPDYCRASRSAMQYQSCVLRFYGLQAAGGATLVQGYPGCYSGPVAYRAHGYLEGQGPTFSLIGTVTPSYELVYDFATMERRGFLTTFIGISDNIVGVSILQYAGEVHGFQSNSSLLADYSGWSDAWYFDASTDWLAQPIAGAIGLAFTRSRVDPNIQALSIFLGVGVNFDAIPILDVGLGFTEAVPAPVPNRPNKSYTLIRGLAQGVRCAKSGPVMKQRV